MNYIEINIILSSILIDSLYLFFEKKNYAWLYYYALTGLIGKNSVQIMH